MATDSQRDRADQYWLQTHRDIELISIELQTPREIELITDQYWLQTRRGIELISIGYRLTER